MLSFIKFNEVVRILRYRCWYLIFFLLNLDEFFSLFDYIFLRIFLCCFVPKLTLILRLCTVQLPLRRATKRQTAARAKIRIAADIFAARSAAAAAPQQVEEAHSFISSEIEGTYIKSCQNQQQ